MSQENFTAEEADRLLLGDKAPPIVEETPAVVEEPVVEETPPVEPVVEEEVPATPVEGEVEQKPAPTEEKVDAWLESVPEDVRGKVQERLDALAQAEHKIRSDDGRVRAFQRQAEELKQQLKKMSGTPQTPAATVDAPTTNEGWQQLIDHDPVLAEILEARVKAEIQELKKTAIDPLHRRQETNEAIERSDVVARERARLAELIPDVDDIIKQPLFQGWLEHEAPPTLQRAFHDSLDHRDYLAVFNQFAVDMINTGRVSPNGQQPSAAAPTAPNAVDPQRAQNIADARARKLNQPPVSGSTPAPSGGLDFNKPITAEDADALILQMWNKEHKK